MKIAILGAGAVGSALTEGWTRDGREIVVGVRDPEDPKYAELAARTGAEIALVSQATAAADAIVLAVPWDTVEGVLANIGDLGGKPLIDATNPLQFAEGKLNLVQPGGLSGGEHVGRWAQNARVVKTLNQVGAEMMAAEKAMAAKPCMFIAGDDSEANQTAAELVGALGFEALQAGGLEQARHLEHLAMVWINQALVQGLGRSWAFGALRNGEGRK